MRLDAELDSSFRPLYDLLVRADGAGLGGDGQLVEESFLGYPGPTALTLDDVAAIRSIPGVDVAAPVGVVGYLESTTAAPLVTIEVPVEPTWYSGTVRLFADNGAERVTTYEQSFSVAITPSNHQIRVQSRGLIGYAIDDSAEEIVLQLRPLASVRDPVVAVDPAAESDLLRVASPGLVALEEAGDAVSLGDWEGGVTGPKFQAAEEFVHLSQMIARDQGSVAALERPVIPLVVNDHRDQRLVLELSGAEVDSTVPESGDTLPATPAEDLVDAGVNTIAVDFVPFTDPVLTLAWPGQDGSTAGRYRGPIDQSFTAGLLSAPDYQLDPADPATVSIEPLGTFTDPSVGWAPEQQYRAIHESDADGAGGSFVTSDPYARPFHLLPLATFDIDEFDVDASALNYVPIGTYDQPATEWVEAPDGTSRSQPMYPTLLPTGLVKPAPAALVDITNAVAIRGDRVVDAVRVRLDPEFSYSLEGIGRISDIATIISDLGFEVDIMAGSSPQQVSIDVPAFMSGGGDLGRVTEPWARVGAAVEVDRSVTATTYTVAVLTFLGALLMAWAVHLAESARATQAAQLLTESGWTGRQVTWWLLRPSVVASLVGLGAAAAIVVTPWWTTGTIGVVTTMLVVGVWLGSAVVGVSLALRRASSAARSETRAVRSLRRLRPWSLARVSVTRPLALTASQVLAASIAGLTLAPALLATWAQTTTVGTTRLGNAVNDELRGRQIAMLLVTATAAICAYVTAAQRERRMRRTDDVVLHEIGWSRNATDSWRRRRHTLYGACAAGVAVAFAPLTAAVFDLPIPETTLAALLAVAILSMLAVLTGRDRFERDPDGTD